MTRSRLAVVSAVLMVVLASGGFAVSAQPAATQTGETVNCSYPIEVTDATGETVSIGEEPDRVVVLAPSGAQVMWAIGAQDKVVGMPVNIYTSYLNGSETRTNVLNSDLQPITEKVVGLEPDLVLAPNIIEDDSVENLRQKGLTVVRFEEAGSIDDVGEKTRLTGRLVGSYDEAARVSAETKATVERVREATADEDNPSVYYAMGGGYTAGSATFIGDVISAAGGDNIASAADISTYGVISEEVVAAEDPDWIVMPEGRSLRASPAINATTAVENGQIVRVDANFISQPGPRVTQPLTRLAGAFHPDVAGNYSLDLGSIAVPQCENGDPVATNGTVTLTIPENENATVSDTSETEGGFGPGFGPVAALLALLAGGLLARRY